MNYLKITLSLLALSLSQHAYGATILYYDSNSDVGSTVALERIDTETDGAFVASSDATTSVGSGVAAIGAHGSQTHTVTLGTGNDLMFRFGTGAYSDDLPTALADGKWLGASFVAAQDLNLDELTFLLYNNSGSASSYAARDVGLYVRIGTVGGFTQFGDIDDSATGNGIQGTITFADKFTVLSGQTVQLRLAFTDRTRTNADAQAATRIGSIDISATAGGDATKVTTSPTAPTTNILISDGTGTIDTGLFDEAVNANHARGQAFSLPAGSETGYEITAITIKKSNTQAYSNDAIVLRIFEGTTAQWNPGTGHSTGTDGGDYYVDTSVTPLHTEVFTLNGTFTDDDYVTFTLSQPIIVNEDSDFGFFMTYHQVGGSQGDFRHLENNNGGRLSITTTSHGTAARGLHYFVQGLGTNLVLASPFQDRMVLQRGKPVKVWGEALPSTAVSATFDGTTVNGTSDVNGDWELELPTHAAGGPYSLEVTSGVETKTVSDVLVGDVWFCFGQSNMVYTLNQMQSWHDSYENAIIANDNIRCLKIVQDAALTEEETAGMNWLDNSTAGTWTAVGSVFAYELNLSTQDVSMPNGVPVAIIWAAWGSSAIEGWMPLELADQFPHFDEMLNLYQSVGEYESNTTINSTISNSPYSYGSNLAAITDLTANGWSGTPLDVFIRTRPNIIYNKMVHPMRKYGISGFIWYQGEANAGAPNYAQYRFTLPKFVTEYRERFDQGDLPFLGVQLPSYGSGTYWPWFRESQDQIHTLNNGHVAVSIDTGDAAGNIHPTNTSKEEIGTRLSLLARKYALGESIVADSPRYQSMSIAGDEVTITFDSAVGLTTDDALDPAEFELAGVNEVFYPATSSSISGSDVIISASANVPNPVAVRYAWSPAPLNEVNLVNGAGLPAAPFRTDSFAPDGIPAEAPVGVQDSFSTARDVVLNVPASGVLDNDIDLNYDSLSASLIADVSNGSLTLYSNGSFDYTPTEGFAGTDSFTYQATDGGLNTATTTVTITVTGDPSGYYTWRQTVSWDPSDDETSTGDADADGILNIHEFAFGMNPKLSDASNLIVTGGSFTPGTPTIDLSFDPFEVKARFIRLANHATIGINYTVQFSHNLSAWEAVDDIDGATAVIIPGTSASNGYEAVEVDYPVFLNNGMKAAQFFRLGITVD
ncbi:MAG: sialate O-acetylesterase [Opitutaceae bacterium]